MKSLKYIPWLLLSVGGLVLTRPAMAADLSKETYATASLVMEERIEPIDTRSERLEKYLQSINSPMALSAKQFVEQADKYQLDWKLVAAIAGNESYFGKFIPYNSFNSWGWGVWTGMSYGTNFTDWNHGIATVSEGLKKNYIDMGLTTIENIGRKYAADPQWSWKVRHFMNEIEAFNIYQKDERLLALAL
jgi:hypothetical protein